MAQLKINIKQLALAAMRQAQGDYTYSRDKGLDLELAKNDLELGQQGLSNTNSKSDRQQYKYLLSRVEFLKTYVHHYNHLYTNGINNL